MSRLPDRLKGLLIDVYARLAEERMRRAKGPARLILYVTGRCTRRCRYCFYINHLSDGDSAEMNLNEIRALAGSLPRRLSLITLTGGEPLLRKDLPEIVQAFSQINRTRTISIVTNGDLPSEAESAASRMLETTSSSLSFTVSVQSLEDLQPGSGPADTLEKLIKQQRRDDRIELVAAQTTLSRDNVEQLDELMETIERRWRIPYKLQFIRGVTGNVFPSGGAVLSDLTPNDFGAQELSIEQQLAAIESVRKRLQHSQHSLSMHTELLLLELSLQVLQTKQAPFPCVAGSADCVVFERGAVSVCENLAPFAELRDFDMDFAALWRSIQARQAQRAVAGCACTHPCNLATSLSYSSKGLRGLLL